jgi:uncharacterized protein affecting Mg2+/Co2+ transport
VGDFCIRVKVLQGCLKIEAREADKPNIYIFGYEIQLTHAAYNLVSFLAKQWSYSYLVASLIMKNLYFLKLFSYF